MPATYYPLITVSTMNRTKVCSINIIPKVAAHLVHAASVLNTVTALAVEPLHADVTLNHLSLLW